jgi:hypothetical protein
MILSIFFLRLSCKTTNGASIMEVGYIQHQCPWANISHTTIGIFYAEPGAGSFCCGMFGLVIYILTNICFGCTPQLDK